MQKLTNTLSEAIIELFADVVASGQLTPNARYGIRDALLSGLLEEDEQRCIDRLVYSVR
jgi:hypothetical protein